MLPALRTRAAPQTRSPLKTFTMAEEVVNAWLAQRPAWAVNYESAIRTGIRNFAKRRLPPDQVKVATDIVLEHFFPERRYHGRIYVDMLEPTVSGTLDAWLSKPRDDVSKHNVYKAARSFAERRGLNERMAREVGRRAVAELSGEAAPQTPFVPVPGGEAAPETPCLPVPRGKAAHKHRS